MTRAEPLNPTRIDNTTSDNSNDAPKGTDQVHSFSHKGNLLFGWPWQDSSGYLVEHAYVVLFL